jgi:hypothetical protein
MGKMGTIGRMAGACNFGNSREEVFTVVPFKFQVLGCGDRSSQHIV